MSTAMRAVATFETEHKQNLEKGWAAYQTKLAKAPETIRTYHATMQQEMIKNNSTEFLTILKKKWVEWHKTVKGDSRVLKDCCGGPLERLLREWAVLPDQNVVREVYQMVGLENYISHSEQNPRKTTMKCWVQPRAAVKVPGRRPASKKSKSNGVVIPPPDTLLSMIHRAVEVFQRMCPTEKEKKDLVTRDRWTCLNSELLTLTVPLEQYQSYAISKGIMAQIEQETFRGGAADAHMHMHRRHTTSGMRRHSFIVGFDGNQTAAKRQRLT
jgi:hypothetical protein